MPRLQRPGANSDLIKNSEDRDCTARHVQRRDGLIEETMEIDELPENDERLLKKAEIKRDEMGRFEQHGAIRIQPGGAKLAKCEEKAS